MRGAAVVCVAAVLACAGCGSMSYYSQLARGQYDLLHRRQPIDQLIADPRTPEGLREHLRIAQDARVFASERLDLPRNGSYTQYADLGRDAAVWNVFATPEFSLAPRESCFVIAGCVAYRGYFQQPDAQAYGRSLQAKGDDVWISAIPTYSTLGWFDDPVLNTMLDRDDLVMVGEIFHELAHQKFYVRDDTAFNESFAMFVQQQGEREWCAARGRPPPGGAEHERWRSVVALVMQARARLSALYRSSLPAEEMRQRKRQEFALLRSEYNDLKTTRWNGYAGFDGWFAATMNNATLLPFGLYDQYVPAFAALFRQNGGHWPAFFAAAEAIGHRPHAERRKALAELAPSVGEVDE